MACNLDTVRDLYSNIVLSGGTTMFKGFRERFYKEIKHLANPTMRVQVIASPDRKFAVWQGGSILSSLSSFDGSWISRADYDEFGETVVHRRCF